MSRERCCLDVKPAEQLVDSDPLRERTTGERLEQRILRGFAAPVAFILLGMGLSRSYLCSQILNLALKMLDLELRSLIAT